MELEEARVGTLISIAWCRFRAFVELLRNSLQRFLFVGGHVCMYGYAM
jgi:hypothetical protein